MGLLVRTFVRGRTALKELGSATVRVPREGPGSRATSLRIPTGSGVRLLREGEDPRVDKPPSETESPEPAWYPPVTVRLLGDRMDVGPTLVKGHPRSLDHGCNVRSTCRCSVYPAIHTTTRSLLRSSSTHEPSDPPLRVVLWLLRLHVGRRNGVGLGLRNPTESQTSKGGGRQTHDRTFRPGHTSP